MSNYNNLKSSINNNIYENQTQQITGTVLNAILNEMTNALGAGYQFAGVATVGMTPSEPDARIFYLAGEGIYTSFDGIQVPAGKLGILKWDSRWHLETIDGLGSGGANLTGYVTVASTDDLPDEGVATLGYLCGENLYLYVGEGGDTKEGKYQNCGSFRGPQGDSVQDVEQTQTSLENGGVNKIKFTLSNGISCEFQVRNGTTSSGLFPNLAALQAAYPSPVVGQYAFVGSGFPADIYVCTTAGTWTDSGEDYDGDNVDLTDYATKAEVTELEHKVGGLIYKTTATKFSDYNPSISELYFTKSALNGVASIDFRNYSAYLYAVAKDSNNSSLWVVNAFSLSPVQNGIVVPLIATSAGGSVSVGDIVGYVVFSDIATFSTVNVANASSSPLNLDYVSRHTNAPLVSAYIESTRHLKWNKFSDASVSDNYEKCVSELYINKEIYQKSGLSGVSCSAYGGYFNLYGKNGSTVVWHMQRSLSTFKNGEVAPLFITTGGGGLVYGDIVGYIVFSDVSTFGTKTSTGANVSLNLDTVTEIKYSPLIQSSSYYVEGRFRIAENCPIYRMNESISAYGIYNNCVKELWVNTKFLNGITDISVKNYSGIIYVDARAGSSTIWSSSFSLANYVDGDVIPIKVSAAGGDAHLNDTVGYIIFSDIATFKATNYGSYVYVNFDRAVRLDLNKDIWYAITAFQNEIAQSINEKMVGGLEVILPSIIYAAVGVQLNIYNDAIAVSMDKGLYSPTNYIVRWACSKGTITNRGFRYTPVVGDIGNVLLTCYVYTISGELYVTKTCTIKVVAASIASAKRVVFFGDSTGAGSATALDADFNDAGLFSGTKPTMLGIRGTTTKYQAFGGARWADYATRGRAAYRCQVSGVGAIALYSQYTNNGFTWTVVEVNVTEGVGNILITKNDLYSSADAPETNGTLIPVGGGDNIAYTGATKDSGNPLWYNNAIDFSHYRDTLGLGANEKLDLVSFQLGLNGSEDDATLRQYIIDLYNAAVADNANCIFLVGLVTGPCNTVDAFGVNYGVGDWMTTIREYHRKRKVYEELVESGDYPNMRIATPNLNIDRYYGFPLGTRAVSARNNTQEEYHTNFVHPSESGYAQIADAFFSAYIATLNE